MPLRPMLALALLAAAIGAARAGAPAQAPLEAYVSPPSLFPDQDAFPPGFAKAYRPLPAYAAPDGKLVGHVDTNYAKCGAGCEAVTARLVTLDGKRHPLPIDFRSASVQALLTHEAPTVSGALAWSKIHYAQGQFWIRTAPKDIYPFEDLAMFADNFDTVCSKPGNCQPMTPALRKHVAALPFQGCVSYPYEIEKVVSVDGKRYYQVKLQEVDIGKIKLQIPRRGFVPTRNKDGSHTGIHEPQGC